MPFDEEMMEQIRALVKEEIAAAMAGSEPPAELQDGETTEAPAGDVEAVAEAAAEQKVEEVVDAKVEEAVAAAIEPVAEKVEEVEKEVQELAKKTAPVKTLSKGKPSEPTEWKDIPEVKIDGKKIGGV